MRVSSRRGKKNKLPRKKILFGINLGFKGKDLLTELSRWEGEQHHINPYGTRGITATGWATTPCREHNSPGEGT